MKKEKISNFLIFLSIVLLLNSVSAQNSKTLRSSLEYQFPLIGKEYTSPVKGEGSPFLYDKWNSGFIALETGDSVKVKFLIFDCLNNKIVCRTGNGEMVELDRNLVKRFRIYSSEKGIIREFEKLSIKLPFISDSALQYLEVLGKGKFNLYLNYKIKVYSKKPEGNESSRYLINNYSQMELFYLQIENLPVKLIKASRKGLINAYPNYSYKVKKILKDNHVFRIHNQDHLCKAIEIINLNWN